MIPHKTPKAVSGGMPEDESGYPSCTGDWGLVPRAKSACDQKNESEHLRN
jgi:hypothetical protein